MPVELNWSVNRKLFYENKLFFIPTYVSKTNAKETLKISLDVYIENKSNQPLK